MSQKTGNTIIIVIVILLNLWLLSGGHSGRGQDYIEAQNNNTGSP